MLKNVKITTKFNILNLFAPLNCRSCGKLGNPLCERCKNYNTENRQNLCPNCKTPNISGFCKKCQNKIPVFVFDHKKNLVGDLIKDYKYSAVKAVGEILADFYDTILPVLPPKTVIVPLPTSTRHIRERGFDHMLLVARKLARKRKLKVTRPLVRAKNTVQVGTDAKTRHSQAKQAYTLAEKYKIDPETTYLLLDDVWTTGASMEAAVSILKKAGAKKIIVGILALT